MRHLTLALSITAIVLFIGAATFILSKPAGNDLKPISEEESLEIAREFLINSPTFKFDGIEETLKHVETNTFRCPYCWEFVFTFQSRHAGYGDRTGQMLAQVITPHTAYIIVQEGKVIHAVLDNQWDMIDQEMLPK